MSSGVSRPFGEVIAEAERVALGTEELVTELAEFCLEGVDEFSGRGVPRGYEMGFASGIGTLLLAAALCLAVDCATVAGSSLGLNDTSGVGEPVRPWAV
jgi:hypothetical protein